MKKYKISRSSNAAILIVILVLLWTRDLVVVHRIISDFTIQMTESKALFSLVSEDNKGTESSSSKNDGVQDYSVVLHTGLLEDKLVTTGKRRRFTTTKKTSLSSTRLKSARQELIGTEPNGNA